MDSRSDRRDPVSERPQHQSGHDADVALQDTQERCELALDIGELASWDWNLRTGEVKWNDRHFLIQGYGINEVPPSYEAWLARVPRCHRRDRRTRARHPPDVRVRVPDAPDRRHHSLVRSAWPFLL